MPAIARASKLVFSPGISVPHPTVFLNPVVARRPLGSGGDVARQVVTPAKAGEALDGVAFALVTYVLNLARVAS